MMPLHRVQRVVFSTRPVLSTNRSQVLPRRCIRITSEEPGHAKPGTRDPAPVQQGTRNLHIAAEETFRKEHLSFGDMMKRKGPRTDIKKLPSDATFLRIHVKSIEHMSELEVSHFADIMNQYGAAVIVPEIDSGVGAYKTLDRLLGTCVSHDRMDQRGVVEINPAKPTSVNTAQPEKAHLPHTDDAYMEAPSRFITLQCREAAPSGGGESVLVSGADLLAAMNRNELSNLMRPGMVSMGRKKANEDSFMETSSIPMFWLNRESGWLQLRWRCMDACVQDVNPQALDAYQRLDQVARTDVHQLIVPLQPLELLIVDNRANAHGRREYNLNEPRVMWRRNYIGDGELDTKLNVGMCNALSSVFDACSSVFEEDYDSDYSDYEPSDSQDLPE